MIRACITSVQYGDLLAVTLPGWVKLLGAEALTVVTRADDTETQAVARANGVCACLSDAWTRHDPTFAPPAHWHAYWRERGRVDARGKLDLRPVFNKALALDETFGFVPTGGYLRPEPGALCLAIDADCAPEGTLPDESTFLPGVIYGARRFEGNNDLTRGPEIKLRGRVLQSQHRHAAPVAGGYFQLFRYQPGMRFGSYPGADGYDYDFAFTFPKGIVLESLAVVHFGETHVNWWGRKTPRFVPAVQA